MRFVCTSNKDHVVVVVVVLRRPCSKHDYLPPSLDAIAQVDHIICLGVVFQQSLIFEIHVQSVPRQCSQRLYLLKMLRSQGIPPDKLYIIFTGIVVARILYAIPAWGLGTSFKYGADW